VSQIRAHTKLCSKNSTLQVTSLNLTPIWWWKEYVSCRMLFWHDKTRLNFTSTSYIICYHATQVVQIFHIFRLLWCK
jgi:hypothetical protein